MTTESVDWRSWGEEAFAEAARRRVPVLLSLSATWCADCHEMDAETYASPRIVAHLEDRFVPVRVDVDRRPRVRERFNMGGFPTTAFLTPDGKLLTGATYLGPEGMRQVLERVDERWQDEREAAGRVPRALAGDPTPGGDVTGFVEEHLAGQLDQQFDPEFAGWGTDAKFPLVPAVEFALKRERQQALDTLGAIRRNLLDDVAGGFFRYAGNRDWSDVHRAKLLASNAALLRAFAHAYLYTGDESHRDVADRTVAYLVEALWTGEAFGGSQGPADEEYWSLDGEARADRTGPRSDYTVFAGDNALAADALLALAAYTDDDRAAEYAERTLDHVASDLIDDGVVTRYRDGDEVGPTRLLADSAHVVAAFARREQVRGEGRATARAVADHAIETLHDDGSFRDGPAEGPGMLDRPLRPIDDNVAMADALLDLAALSGEDRYREVARETVASFAGAADRMGVQVAAYGAVAARLVRDPLVVAVADAPGSALHRAALRVADHEKVVVPAATERLELALPSGSATLVGSDAEAAGDPEELMALVARETGDAAGPGRGE